MIDTSDAHTLTDFQQNADVLVRHMKETGHPLVLTVNGKAELIVQDAHTYEALLERVERTETLAALRQSITEHESGEGRRAADAFDQLRQKHGIPR